MNERKQRTRTTIEIVFTLADGTKRHWHPNNGDRIELVGAVRAMRLDRVRPQHKVKVRK